MGLLNSDTSIGAAAGLLDQAGGVAFFQYSFAAVLGLTAIGRLRDLVTKLIDENTPQAKGKAVSRTMVKRIDFSLTMFFLFAFYSMVSTVFRLPGDRPVDQIIDLAINATLMLLVIVPLFFNTGELIENGKFTLDRVSYQIRLLVRRGVSFSSLGTTAVAVIFKYQLQGFPVIETLLHSIHPA